MNCTNDFFDGFRYNGYRYLYLCLPCLSEGTDRVPQAKEGKKMGGISGLNAGQIQQSYQTGKTNAPADTKATKSKYGNTVGEPKLSEKAQKYYDELKKKYGDVDFVLSDNASADTAVQQANENGFAQTGRTMVLLTEDEIEKMASDEDVRDTYEKVIGDADGQIAKFKEQLGDVAGVVSYGVTIGDDGEANFFAVVDKALAKQQERIKEAKQQAKEAATAEEKAAREKEAKALEEEKEAAGEAEDIYSVNGVSVEDLMAQIKDLNLGWKMESVRTPEEMLVGQNFDIKF